MSWEKYWKKTSGRVELDTEKTQEILKNLRLSWGLGNQITPSPNLHLVKNTVKMKVSHIQNTSCGGKGIQGAK